METIFIDLDSGNFEFEKFEQDRDSVNVQVTLFNRNIMEKYQEISDLFNRIKPNLGKINNVTLKTTESNANLIRPYLWFLPIPIGITIN